MDNHDDADPKQQHQAGNEQGHERVDLLVVNIDQHEKHDQRPYLQYGGTATQPGKDKAVDKDKGLRSIGLKSLDIDLQLDAEELEEANRRLLKSYRIPAIDSRALKTMQNGKRP